MPKEDYDKIRAWIDEQKHLPAFMRDFHDQKDLFKTMGGLNHDPPHPNHTWMDIHICTVDKFLWWMAFHGYTMQKCRTKMPFQDFSEAVTDRENKETEVFRRFLKENK